MKEWINTQIWGFIKDKQVIKNNLKRKPIKFKSFVGFFIFETCHV